MLELKVGTFAQQARQEPHQDHCQVSHRVVKILCAKLANNSETILNYVQFFCTFDEFTRFENNFTRPQIAFLLLLQRNLKSTNPNKTK